MKFYDVSLIIIGILVGICVLGGITSTIWLGPDNPVEEVAEKIIEDETGLKVDLTPETRESPAT